MKKVIVTVTVYCYTFLGDEPSKRDLDVSVNASTREIRDIILKNFPLALGWDHIMIFRKRPKQGDIVELYRLPGIGAPRIDKEVRLILAALAQKGRTKDVLHSRFLTRR